MTALTPGDIVTLHFGEAEWRIVRVMPDGRVEVIAVLSGGTLVVSQSVIWSVVRRAEG